MPSAISEGFWGLVGPFLFLWVSAKALPPTILRLVKERDFGTLLSPRRLQDAWFGTFWGRFGPQVKINASVKVLPLLDGRVVNGKLLDKPAVPGLEGVCIEVGAGAGYWVDIFANKHMDSSSSSSSMGRTKQVTRVYGIEPNPNQHASLRKHIAKAGLEDVYKIVPVGIEDLDNPKKWDGKIEKESVDCIVTVLCLCSIPEPERHIRELYGYLKKGGRWYFYEHVQCSVSRYMKAYQRFINLFWPQFLGGCQLCRPTGEYFRQAGEWQNADIAAPWDAQWHNVVPHVIGVLTK
ncbi:methyltransferase domain-containing protein [Microdochium trichocladiopsis]|uniref:Methyltransferase domain-containing protein n=1 Tax=Microdochium trichocladiopsis TaxID=1682393 RepID=A0A9P8XYD4_9PEZI|nr:methyltransferase domain-containing protein [Microdochium trichocladiopsis]KAH7025950.1 methyltransferase domain-containing protein [Microdochium trichocladiopsis]